MKAPDKIEHQTVKSSPISVLYTTFYCVDDRLTLLTNTRHNSGEKGILIPILDRYLHVLSIRHGRYSMSTVHIGSHSASTVIRNKNGQFNLDDIEEHIRKYNYEALPELAAIMDCVDGQEIPSIITTKELEDIL